MLTQDTVCIYSILVANGPDCHRVVTKLIGSSGEPARLTSKLSTDSEALQDHQTTARS